MTKHFCDRCHRELEKTNALIAMIPDWPAGCEVYDLVRQRDPRGAISEAQTKRMEVCVDCRESFIDWQLRRERTQA